MPTLLARLPQNCLLFTKNSQKSYFCYDIIKKKCIELNYEIIVHCRLYSNYAHSNVFFCHLYVIVYVRTYVGEYST